MVVILKGVVMRAQNAVKSVDKAPDVAYVSIIALGIFFAVMENYDYLKGFGFMLCGAIALVTISSKRCIPKSRVTFSLIGMILLFCRCYIIAFLVLKNTAML